MNRVRFITYLAPCHPSMLHTITNFLILHQHRLYLWCPVLFACGLYMGVIIAVPFWGVVVGLVACGLVWFLGGRFMEGMGIYGVRAVVVVVAGVMWVNGWLHGGLGGVQSAPKSLSYGGLVVVQGRVLDIHYGDGGRVSYTVGQAHMVRTRHKSASFGAGELDSDRMVLVGDIRLSGDWHKVLGQKFTPKVGDVIMGKGVILPPTNPLFVGGFNRAEYHALSGIAGQVHVMGKYVPSWGIRADNFGGGGFADWVLHYGTGLQDIRHGVVDRILAVRPNDGGAIQGVDKPTISQAIAIALMVGKRDFMDSDNKQAIQESGLAHVMAISGMHVGLVIMMVFFVVRRGLACVPPIALRYNIKIWAVVLALPVAVLYVAVSGMGIPAVRALGMATLALVAVVAYRTVLTLRLVCVVACMMMAFNPVVFMQVGFLLSFSAVVALVAFAEFYNAKFQVPLLQVKKSMANPVVSVGFGVGVYFVALMASSLIATLATVPSVVQYFGTVPLYSVVANMLVIPVVAFWVMPLGVVSAIAMIFGAEHAVLPLMYMGIDWMVWVSHWVQGLPHSVLYFAPNPLWVYGSALLGGLWWVIWKHSPVRYGGLLVFFVGAGVSLITPKPDVMVSQTGTVVAVRHGGSASIIGWSTTAQKPYVQKTVAKTMGLSPKGVGVVICAKKTACDAGADFGKVVVIPYNAPLYAEKRRGKTVLKPIAYYCQQPNVALIIAPKTYVDYGACAVPIVGRADTATAVNVFAGTVDNNNTIIIRPENPPLLSRLHRANIPYVQDNK